MQKRRNYVIATLALLLVAIMTPSYGSAAASGDVLGTPVLVTAAGQSADMALLVKMLQMAAIDHVANATATAGDIGSAKTVIIVPGVSTKGLGAAGVSADRELKRVLDFAQAAEASGATVVLAHVGGKTRRDKLSDQFIDEILKVSDYIVVMATGNADGKFSNYASANGIPIVIPPSLAEVTNALKTLFGK